MRDYARLDGWVLMPLSTSGMDVRPETSEEEAEAAEDRLIQTAQELQDRLEEVHPRTVSSRMLSDNEMAEAAKSLHRASCCFKRDNLQDLQDCSWPQNAEQSGDNCGKHPLPNTVGQ